MNHIKNFCYKTYVQRFVINCLEMNIFAIFFLHVFLLHIFLNYILVKKCNGAFILALIMVNLV